MFGPLPVLHRIVLGTISLCFGIVAGVWIAHSTPLPMAVSGGALAGGWSDCSWRTSWSTPRSPSRVRCA